MAEVCARSVFAFDIFTLISISVSISISYLDYIKFLSLHIYPQYEPIHIWSQKYTLQANSDFFYFHLQNCWRWDCFIGTRSYMTYMLYWSLLEKQGFCQFYCKRVWRPDTLLLSCLANVYHLEFHMLFRKDHKGPRI
jgi:hypothetical protein